MATCKRCGGARLVPGEVWIDPGFYVPSPGPCPDCKGTGKVGDDSERAGDNTNKGDGDDDA